MAEQKESSHYNRKASHDYFLEDRFEAGLELQGTEIKSVRNGKVQLKDAYISFVNNEAFVKEMHISPYDVRQPVQSRGDPGPQAACCTGMRSGKSAAEGSVKRIYDRSDFRIFITRIGKNGDCVGKRKKTA